MSVMTREVEAKILRAAVESLLRAGYRLSVSLENGYDLDEMLLGSRDADKIVKAAMAGDECHIFVHKTGAAVKDGMINAVGWLHFVYGGDGWDVISDYTTNLDAHLAEAHKISRHYGPRHPLSHL